MRGSRAFRQNGRAAPAVVAVVAVVEAAAGSVPGAIAPKTVPIMTAKSGLSQLSVNVVPPHDL